MEPCHSLSGVLAAAKSNTTFHILTSDLKGFSFSFPVPPAAIDCSQGDVFIACNAPSKLIRLPSAMGQRQQVASWDIPLRPSHLYQLTLKKTLP